jgi:hypothetical protein
MLFMNFVYQVALYLIMTIFYNFFIVIVRLAIILALVFLIT